METVIIIGAGPAGLTAGYELLKKKRDYRIIILEATDVVGGLSRTVEHNGNRMDLGGHRFFSKDREVTAMWNELMPQQGAPSFDDLKLSRAIRLAPGGPDPEREDLVMLTRNRLSRIYYRKKFFNYPIKISFETICKLGIFTTVAAGFSYLKSLIFKHRENSLENFYINRFGYRLYSLFFEGYTEKLWGRHPKDISADWGAQRVKGLSILAVLKNILHKLRPACKQAVHIETSLIEEFYYPKLGPGQFWENVAEKIMQMGGRIVFNCEVRQLIESRHSIQKVICLHRGKLREFSGDIFISSMPLKELVLGLNQVPPQVLEIARGLPYRDFITIGLLLEKLNLKNETGIKTLNNIIPDCWIYVQDNGVKLGRIQIFNNWSPYLVARPEDTIWIGLEYFCDEGDVFWNMTDEQLFRHGLEELASMGIIAPCTMPLDHHVEKVRKAYPAYFDTYRDIDQLITYLNSLKNLYCIGRNGQHRYNNMDHSMATAFETVRTILGSTPRNKTAIWNVNTEKEYHEEKKSTEYSNCDTGGKRS